MATRQPVRRLVGRFDGIIVDLQLVDTPPFMASAVKNLLKSVQTESTAYGNIASYLIGKEDWSQYSPEWETERRTLG